MQQVEGHGYFPAQTWSDTLTWFREVCSAIARDRLTIVLKEGMRVFPMVLRRQVQPTQGAGNVGRVWPSRWAPLLLLSTMLLALACGTDSDELVSRFLLGGWVLPMDDEPEADPFAETLKAFVITSEQELRNFLSGLDLIRIRGNMETLNRTDFSEEIVLAAYYFWRPLKGDPLYVQTVALRGTEVTIHLDLEEGPQGHESPYLLAPMSITAIDKSDLPQGTPLQVVWRVNGKEAANMMVTLD